MVEFTCETIWPWAFVCWKILITISQFVIGLLIYSIFPCSVLGGCTVLKICPFLWGYLFYWHIVAHCSLIWFFFSCISALSTVTSFSFLILLFWVFPFFLMSLANSLSILFILSKNQLLPLLGFAMVSLFLLHLFLP